MTTTRTDICTQENPRSTAILAVAKANNLELEVVDTKIPVTDPKYLALNKLGKVPTFEGADGYVLSECIAIAIYSTIPLPIHFLLFAMMNNHYNLQLSLSE